MALDLSKVRERELLKSQREPHWQRLRPGCFIGFRPSARGGAGTWIARAYDADNRLYRMKALGDFGALPGRDQFTVAKKEAEQFADVVEGGGLQANAVQTVEEACRQYAASNVEAEGRFRRLIYNDPISKVKLAKLRRHHLSAWRVRLEAKPALVTRGKSGEQRLRPRAASSVNRDMSVLRAALNKVLPPGAPSTEAAWQEALVSIKNADRQRTLYLDRGQRRALLEQMDEAAEPFFRALCLLPLRPGAVANLTVGCFDARTSELTIGEDKSGKPRRIVVPGGAAGLFKEQARDKPPGAPLLSRRNGSAWDRHTWKDPIAAAAKAARLPAGVTAYTLRHSTITDLVNARLPLLTIAQISDTSVEMIERHYGHLCADAAVDALATLDL